MLRVLAALLFILSEPAYASTCSAPSFYDGYSGQFFPSPTYTSKTTGFIYGLDEQTLYVSFYNGSITEFYPVLQQTAQNFNYSKYPDAFYKSQILGIYPEVSVCGDPPFG